jgi:GMP synthase (glutamine-hydrolysing)
MTRTAVALRHVAFEDLGSFASVLGRQSFVLTELEASDNRFEAAEDADLVIVLGGPIGAYDEHRFPFLRSELALLERRLSASRPTLGICLGAQLMARALGARVYPGEKKEIGWSALELSEAGKGSVLRELEGVSVLHWHGDTFDLPAGAVRLASTALYENQAFEWQGAALALQFHAEIPKTGIERWLVGHFSELASAGIEVTELRRETTEHAPKLEPRGRRLLEAWLNQRFSL